MFKLMNDPSSDIMNNFSPEEYRISRKRIIENILATDMALHHKHLSSLKTRSETMGIKRGSNLNKLISSENVQKTFENQQSVLDLIVHSADISSPSKSFKLSETWKKLVYEEFFIQGDLEKSMGQKISLLCDREKTELNKSQVGFISFVVSPTFELLANFFPDTMMFNHNINLNLKKYQNLLKESEKNSVKEKDK